VEIQEEMGEGPVIRIALQVKEGNLRVAFQETEAQETEVQEVEAQEEGAAVVLE
jgi:hypothetical protein